MDIKRTPKSKINKRIRTGVLIAGGVLAITGITFGLSKLKPAAPTLDRSTAVIATVKRGQMIREVRGVGTLVPQLTRWVPAPADGRVEKILIQPGVEVGADTVIFELSNPQLQQEAIDAEFQMRAAEADKESLRVRLQSDTLTQQSTIASIKAEYSQAKMQLDTDEVLGRQGLVPSILLKVARSRVQDLADRLKVEQDRLAMAARSTKAQINSQDARINQLRALSKLRREQASALLVRAGTSGVLQEVSVQVGQQVNPGVNMARVADPASLKAELRIAETQIKDVRIGQKVAVDTRNGIIEAQVSRIDPAAREGTFTVDAQLIGELPESARPDLSVDGTIELERLDNVLHMGRPAFGQGQQTVGIFRLTPDGSEAVRTTVSLGRQSVSTIEILSGLNEGDQVILSDTSAMDDYERILIR